MAMTEKSDPLSTILHGSTPMFGLDVENYYDGGCVRGTKVTSVALTLIEPHLTLMKPPLTLMPQLTLMR